MNTNAPSEEVRVHFTDVGRPAQQFLTCTATWTYASEDELEELAENREIGALLGRLGARLQDAGDIAVDIADDGRDLTQGDGEGIGHGRLFMLFLSTCEGFHSAASSMACISSSERPK